MRFLPNTVVDRSVPIAETREHTLALKVRYAVAVQIPEGPSCHVHPPACELPRQIRDTSRGCTEVVVDSVSVIINLHARHRIQINDRLLARLRARCSASRRSRYLRRALRVGEIDTRAAQTAAWLKHAYRMSLGDTFAAATAIRHGCELWTGDAELL